jgi:serine/threonine protein kinase/Flp pilus assembly protein TadD
VRRKPEREPPRTVLPGQLDAWTARAEYSPGDQIYDRYWVMHRRSGGVNDVYLCTEMGTWHKVAVKIPRPRGPDKTGIEHWDIFQEEVRNWAELGEHPNVTRCHYAGVRDGRWFLVMEWVGYPDSGTDLHDHSSALATMDPGPKLREIVRIARGICDGLAFIHAHGIVHGDLKPSNVLLDKKGRAKITDLGAGSRAGPVGRHMLRASDGPAGTPEYRAPELWEGKHPTIQTDIYALGCILHELATGKPFHEGTVVPPRRRRTIRLAATPDISGPLRQLIANCLHPDPARRPASASQVGERLAAILPPEQDDGAPAAETGDAEDDPDREYARLPELRSSLRASLLSAAGRRADAISQMSTAIRDQMSGLLIQGGKYVSDQPTSSLALAFNDRGGLIAATDDWIKSTGDFLTAIRLHPRLAVAYANLGMNWQRLNCPTIAIVAYNHAIELDPGDHRLYLMRARLLSQHGWHAAAHADYERAVAIAPDDPDVCYGMADSLAALGRGAEALQYRQKGLRPGHNPDDTPQYHRPVSMRGHSGVLNHTITAHFKSDEGDYETAIAAYTAALEIEPWRTEILCDRAQDRLEAGDAPGAIDDLIAFFARASTTHPRVPTARDLLRRAREAAGHPQPHADEPGDDPYPLPSFIAGKIQGQPSTVPLINLLPLKPQQRLVLLDMLYAGDPGRKLRAERLLWNAYFEYFENQRARYSEIAQDLAGEAGQEPAAQFTAAHLATKVAIRNGFGIPVLLTEVQLSPNPLHDVRFSGSSPPSLGWASSGAVGVWEVIPGIQTYHVVLDEPRQAPLFSADDSTYLLVAEHEFALSPQDQPARSWSAEQATVLAGCLCDPGTLAIGLSTGSLVFLDWDGTADPESVQLPESDLDDLHLWQTADAGITAYTGQAFYHVLPPHQEPGGQCTRLIEIPRPSEGRLLAASGSRLLWAVSRDELLLTSLGQPGTDVRLAAPDSTDEGFTAAAISSDGSVVAAVCGSFLHIWRAAEDDGSHGYVPMTMTPQPSGRCIALSSDGSYIAVGTSAGSVLIYVTGTEGEQ